MPDITIRRAERGDEDALLALWTRFLDEQGTFDGRFQLAEDAAERWRNDFPAWLKAERRRVFVAEDGDALVGFATAQRYAPPPIYALTSEVFVEELYVSPDARHKGAAGALLGGVRSWGEEIGAVRIRLGALAANEEARSFWEHQGARAFSVTYTIELKAPQDAGVAEEGSVKPKAKLGFL